ncbi:Hypothetical protein, putative [Bodo saltans]|uniref:C2 domain-containing protein n=1 Tax=Bodo saltans TaxID=75058 RepID=A0A0S4ITZ9_BODSA|nr:Hypothetical protein, putative [Bodo saltans]|eukprot:CUF92280.1 Hypothetical protein, putative [Bodo saltans]
MPSQPSSLERKLIVLLIGCKDLPGHRATGVNDAYVSLKIMEEYYKADEVSVATPEVLQLTTSDVVGDNGFGDLLQPNESVNVESLAHTAVISSDGSPMNSVEGGTPALGGRRQSVAFSPTVMSERKTSFSAPRRQSMRRQSMRRGSSFSGNSLPDTKNLEKVVEMLDGQKYQSSLKQSTSNPEYGQVFVFDHLQIPLRRRSNSMLLNNTLTGGSDPTIARRLHVDRKKINGKFTLRLEVMDTTSSKGLGERFCFGEVQLGELQQGKRTTLWVPLDTDTSVDNIIRPSTAALESLDGLAETQAEMEARIAKYEKRPKIGLVLEPVNFGVLPESVRNESTDEAILRALKEELGTIFESSLLRKLHSFLTSADEQGVEWFEREDVVEMILELYFFTGTSAPPDVDIVEEVQYLMALFDRAPDEGVNISELCGILKMSKFAVSIHPRWLVGRKLSVVTASSIAGALWDPAALPPPFEYAGYRRANGAVYEKTKRPTMPKLPLYAVKAYVNLYNELYADEEARHAKIELERLALEEEDEARRQRDEEDHKRGHYRDDTTPMFLPKSDKNRRYTEDREERSLAQLFAPPRVRTARDDDLPSTFHEHIDKKIVEYALLQQCQVKDSVLVCCRVRGGRYINCSFECCVLDQAVEVVDASFIRCCDVTQCRISGSTPVNCRMAYTALRECPLVPQCSLYSCDISNGSVVVQSYLRECTIDPTVKDEGANKFDVCRFAEKTRQTLMDKLLESPASLLGE